MAFAALAALEPDRPAHLFHLAYACRASRDDEAARKWIDRYLSSPLSDEDRARGLMLRIDACARTDRQQAERDLVEVRALASHSPAARAVLGGA
jgi:hypothetical protein